MELCDTLKYDNDFELYIHEIDLAEKRKQNYNDLVQLYDQKKKTKIIDNTHDIDEFNYEDKNNNNTIHTTENSNNTTKSTENSNNTTKSTENSNNTTNIYNTNNYYLVKEKELPINIKSSSNNTKPFQLNNHPESKYNPNIQYTRPNIKPNIPQDIRPNIKPNIPRDLPQNPRPNIIPNIKPKIDNNYPNNISKNRFDLDKIKNPLLDSKYLKKENMSPIPLTFDPKNINSKNENKYNLPSQPFTQLKAPDLPIKNNPYQPYQRKNADYPNSRNSRIIPEIKKRNSGFNNNNFYDFDKKKFYNYDPKKYQEFKKNYQQNNKFNKLPFQKNTPVNTDKLTQDKNTKQQLNNSFFNNSKNNINNQKNNNKLSNYLQKINLYLEKTLNTGILSKEEMFNLENDQKDIINKLEMIEKKISNNYFINKKDFHDKFK